MINSQVKLISEQVLKDRGLIHTNVPNAMISPIICTVQDLHVHALLGDALYLKLKTDVKQNALSGNYLLLVQNYLADIIVYGVMSDYVVESTYQSYTKGLTKKRDDFADSITIDELKVISDRYENKRDHYIVRAINYLNNNTSLFSEYRANNTDVNASENFYSPTIYLRPDKTCRC